MNPSNLAANLSIVAIVIAIVGAVRSQWPSLATLFLLLIACVVGFGAELLFVTPSILAAARGGVLDGLAAAGAMHIVDYGATKLGAVLGSAAPSSSKGDQRGFSEVRAMLAFAATAAALLVVVALNACTPTNKAVARTVVDVVKAVCTPQDTIDACVDRLLAEKRQMAARGERLPGADAGRAR